MQDIPFFLNLTLNSELYIEIILKMGRKNEKVTAKGLFLTLNPTDPLSF